MASREFKLFLTLLDEVASYFDIVDNTVKTVDINKKYNIGTSACNAPSEPIQKRRTDFCGNQFSMR